MTYDNFRDAKKKKKTSPVQMFKQSLKLCESPLKFIKLIRWYLFAHNTIQRYTKMNVSSVGNKEIHFTPSTLFLKQIAYPIECIK